jgi:hypothetical protein
MVQPITALSRRARSLLTYHCASGTAWAAFAAVFYFPHIVDITIWIVPKNVGNTVTAWDGSVRLNAHALLVCSLDYHVRVDLEVVYPTCLAIFWISAIALSRAWLWRVV